ncbi:MAG TPA: glucose 1-dehydrogenase [Acetobacteraceae bacterium]|jgi:2-dehydro-3-deoxy-D-gluconate 5-dehydrogenase|nr:glucose 1-dehydrogenase [Acetobacteraceae bacterium]
MRAFELAGKMAVVTGGATGIGFGIASGLAEAGAAVAIAGLDGPEVAPSLAALEAFGRKSAFLAADLGTPEACREMIAEAERTMGRIDILVNNAGIAVLKMPQDYTAGEWRSVLDVNLSGAFYCCQAVHPGMARRGGGKIINVASLLAILATAATAPYAASKGALLQLTRALAVAWAKDKIQVNAVLPGWIDTAMTRAARTEAPSLGDRVLARTPAGRWGLPADFAGVAVFLASAASDFVTGAGITVDGGYGSLG